MLNQSSSWDILKAGKARCDGEDGQRMAAVLSRLDHAVHVELQHSRGFLAAALDLAKLSLLQGVPDLSAQAVRQVLAADTIDSNAHTNCSCCVGVATRQDHLVASPFLPLWQAGHSC